MSVAWVGAGIAAVGAISSAVSSHKAASAQEDAANKAASISTSQYDQTRSDQLAQYQQTRSDQLGQYNQQREDLAPYRAAGTTALGQLASRTGAGGDLATNYQRTPFEADPGYQFRSDQGLKAVNSQAAMQGGLYSGSTLKALARFNSGLASQEYGNYDTRQNNYQNQFNANRDYARGNLASLAGIGQTSTSQTGQAGQAAYGAIGQAGQNAYGTIAQAGNINSNLVGNSLQNAGEARASGYVGTSNAIGNGISQLYNNYNQNQYLNGGNVASTTNQGSNYGSTYVPNSGSPFLDTSGSATINQFKTPYM